MSKYVYPNGFNYVCPKCGASLRWSADWMTSEVGLDYPDDRVAGNWYCPSCDTDYYVVLSNDDESAEVVEVEKYED